MSYLNALRVHFAGSFQVNVSTVNNDTGHFDNGTFQPNDQEMQGPGMVPPNGWFNPAGDAAWRLLGCQVTGASTAKGRDTSVLGCGVADADARVCAKMVDLDPQQQMVSEIWGLQFRITNAQGETVFRGEFDVVGFMDIWMRATGSGDRGDAGGCAMYQSVLHDLHWGDVSFSPALSDLERASAKDGLLSVKFNIDGVNLSFRSPDFMTGRIAGTLGPTTAKEPRHLVLGRQFVASGDWSSFFEPTHGLNFFAGYVDEAASTLFLDLGNAISTATPGGALNDLGDLAVSANGVSLGTLPSQGADGYAGEDWYPRTAGVVALPLNADQLSALRESPIQIAGATDVSIAESDTGAFLRADTFVYRMSPGDTVDVPVYATKWGRPLSGAEITFDFYDDELQAGSLSQRRDCPDPGTPTDPKKGAPSFNGQDKTNADGIAHLSLKANDLGEVRKFHDGSSVDGQVYGIRPMFADKKLAGDPQRISKSNFVSLLAWSTFKAPSPVTWDVIHPIMQQYANLYPVMLEFLDMGDYASVLANHKLLELAMGLDVGNPNHMPVTRDLSPARRAAIMEWLHKPLPAKRGTAPAVSRPAAFTMAAEPPIATEALASAAQGGKAAALARRVGLTRQGTRAVTTDTRERKRVRIRLAPTPEDATLLRKVHAMLQQAVELEHATIPVYLYGLYSLDPSKNKAIARIIESVVIEEMLHMTLASNVLNALGGSPAINLPKFIPSYPGYLPGGVDSSLVVHLRPFSMEQLETYIDIEQPEAPLVFRAGAAMADEDDLTIGEFYEHIEGMIVELGNDAFVPGSRNQIGPDKIDDAVIVTNVDTAVQALQTIVEQGEGTQDTPKEVVGNQYAHYYRFMEIKKGRRLRRVSFTGPPEQQWAYTGAEIPFDHTGVYPVPDDPHAADYRAGSQQRNFCDRFNYTYTGLLNALHAMFNGEPEEYDTAIGLMMSLKGQARQMMSGTPNPRVFTGPSFEYQPRDPGPNAS